MPIQIQTVASHAALKSLPPSIANEAKIRLYCPIAVLDAFREIIKNSKVLGTTFNNPYTGVDQRFPDKAEDFTAFHLQLLARNEAVNTTGTMKITLSDGLLTDDQIARIRCLVKATTIAGVVDVQAYGGYPSAASKVKLESPQKTIIIDQSGFQWQNDFRNTGGLFFYPENPNDSHLPQGYVEFQKALYPLMMNGALRSDTLSPNSLLVNWNQTIPGHIDLDQLEKGFEIEFRQALEAAVFQGEVELAADQKINFKFLKAGMGFFSAGIASAKSQELQQLQTTRLKGIKGALAYLASLPADQRNLGKVKRLELPFSASKQDQKLIDEIETLSKEVGLEWGGAAFEDALTPREGYVNALTNCGDPHAMIGNEGGYASVDAAIASNAPGVCNLRVGFNTLIKTVYTGNNLLTLEERDRIIGAFKDEAQAIILVEKQEAQISPPEDLVHSTEEVTYIRKCAEIQIQLKKLTNIVKAGAVLGVIAAGVGLALLGPLGLLIGVGIFAGSFAFKKYREFDLKVQLTGLTVQREMSEVQRSDSAKKGRALPSAVVEPAVKPSLQPNVVEQQEAVDKPQEGIESNSPAKANKI